jgi:hypothetical protein
LCQAKNAADRAGPTFAIGALGEMTLLASNIHFASGVVVATALLTNVSVRILILSQLIRIRDDV